MFSSAFLMQSLFSSALAFVGKKLTQKTWKAIVHNMLESYLCDSFKWDEHNDEAGGSVIFVRSLVLRPELLNAHLSTSRLKLGKGGFTIGSFRLCVSFCLRSDLGIFSEPWKVELVDVELDLEPLDSASCAPGNASAPAARQILTPCGAGTRRIKPTPLVEDARGAKEDWLPLHKAAENIQFTCRGAVVRVHGELDHVLVLSCNSVSLATTDATWGNSRSHVQEITSCKVLHKVLTIQGLQLCSKGTAHSTLLLRGLNVECRIRKTLDYQLQGSVGADFGGAEYMVELTLDGTEAPQIHVPSLPIRISWDKGSSSYHTSLGGDFSFRMAYTGGPKIISEILSWGRQLNKRGGGRFRRTVNSRKVLSLKAELAEVKARHKAALQQLDTKHSQARKLLSALEGHTRGAKDAQVRRILGQARLMCTTPLMSSQLIEFYKKHDPSKIDGVEGLFRNDHGQLCRALLKKYGEVPAGWKPVLKKHVPVNKHTAVVCEVGADGPTAAPPAGSKAACTPVRLCQTGLVQPTSTYSTDHSVDANQVKPEKGVCTESIDFTKANASHSRANLRFIAASRLASLPPSATCQPAEISRRRGLNAAQDEGCSRACISGAGDHENSESTSGDDDMPEYQFGDVTRAAWGWLTM